MRWNAAAGEQRAHFGGEKQASAAQRVIERLDAETVAREKHSGRRAAAALRHLDHRRSANMPRSLLDGLFAPLFVGVDDYFGIRACAEDVALGLQLAAQFAEIVDFAVEDDGDVPVSFQTGCEPPGRSMMLRRREPATTGGATRIPSSSGPR